MIRTQNIVENLFGATAERFGTPNNTAHRFLGSHFPTNKIETNYEKKANPKNQITINEKVINTNLDLKIKYTQCAKMEKKIALKYTGSRI